MKLYSKKGILTKKGRKLNFLTNKMEDVWVDARGKRVKLDGTEIPYEKYLNDLKTRQRAEFEAKDASRKQAESQKKKKEQELMKKETVQNERKEHLEKLEEIKQAVKEIPQTKIPAYPKFPEFPDHLKEYSKWKKEVIKAIKDSQPEFDLKPVIKAIDDIKIPEVKIPDYPKPTDYTKALDEIKKSLPKDTDLSKVEEILSNLKPFEIPSSLIKNNRIKVEVDRTGGGGGEGGGFDASLLATEANQDPLASYKSAGMDITANPYYFGYLDKEGKWFIKKLDTTSGTTYCRGDSDYTTNWTGHTGLTYGEFNVIF